MIILPVNPEVYISSTEYSSTDAASADDNIASDLTYNGAVPDSSSASVIVNTGATGQKAVGAIFQNNGATMSDATVERLDLSGTAIMYKNSASGSQTHSIYFIRAAGILDFPSLVLKAAWQGGTPTLINTAYGNAYEFPCIENTQLSPAQFNKDVVYNNNISSKGHFLGRTAVRRGATVTLEPLSFIATTDRMNEILELFEKLETRACYVHYKVADKDFVHYGWTENDPKYRYTADEEYVQVSFTLRCPA